MAEHTEGTETPLRRSRRLRKGAPLVITEVGKEMLGLLKETEAEPSGVRAENEEDKHGDEETGLEVTAPPLERGQEPHGIEVVLPKEEDTVLAEVVTVQLPAEHIRVPAETEKSEEKKKRLESAAEPCKRPLLGAKVKSDNREVAVPKGKPKSGRVWKDQNKKRFSGMVKDRPLHTSWDKKMAARRERSLMKDYSKHLKDEKQKAKEEKKRRREENLKRRLENERKAEVVQVITNLAKLKRAKKKQLRRIEKRDTLALVQRGSGINKKADRLEKFLKKKKEATEAKENTN